MTKSENVKTYDLEDRTLSFAKKIRAFGRYWLRVIDTCDEVEQENERRVLEGEASELMNIFGSILRKSG